MATNEIHEHDNSARKEAGEGGRKGLICFLLTVVVDCAGSRQWT